MQSMPKLYLGPGLSQRVHQALTRRLESFMASSSVPSEFPIAENPAVPGQGATMESGSEQGDQGMPVQHEERSKSPIMDREGEEQDRSRSPRHKLSVPEPNPDNPAEILASCTTLAIGVTSMIGALKNSSEKLEVLISNTQTLQHDLVRSLETVATAVTNMSRAVESLTGGVNYNTGRVGAVCGEYLKLRKHLEWSLDRSLSDVMKENAKKKAESGKEMKDLMDQLFEAMDRLQENMKAVAHRLESFQIPAVQEKESEFGPALPPTGHLTPMTPAPAVSIPPGIMPPPAAPPMVPPMVPPQQAFPVVTFAGYSPAKMGEPAMTYPAKLEVQAIKSPPFQVVDESTGNVRCVSPTRRHNPATGTTAFAPLGYVVLKNTNDYRRVYP